METLSRRPEWGNPQADEIISHITTELDKSGVTESYNAALMRIRQQHIDADRQVPPKHHPSYDGKGIIDVIESELPLLPVGLERDDLLDPFHSIATLALVKVDPNTGHILNGSFHRFIAEVHEDNFDRIDPSFDEAQVAVILENALVLRYSGLYPNFDS